MSDSKNQGATAWGEKTERSDGSGKSDEYFNRGSEDGGNHGHRVTNSDDTTEYVRDNEGTEYEKPASEQKD